MQNGDQSRNIEERYTELAKKHHITTEGVDSVMLTLAVGYDLTEEVIAKMLEEGGGTAAKHFDLMAALLGLDPEEIRRIQTEEGVIRDDQDALLDLIRRYFRSDDAYGTLTEYILKNHTLDEKQLEVVSAAIRAGLPQVDILRMVKSGMTAGEMSGCIEYFLTLRGPLSTVTATEKSADKTQKENRTNCPKRKKFWKRRN